MLDMGGVAAADAKTKLDMGKNNKVRAVALDFNLITRSIEKQKKEEKIANVSPLVSKDEKRTSIGAVSPNTEFVQSIADLLHVKLFGETRQSKPSEGDDISRLMGEKPEHVAKKDHIPYMDIRSKYGAKLRSKVEGGLAGVDLANSKKEESLQKGDAAGHFAARALAAANTVTTSGSKWLASTGTGSLLSFLSMRSMKIALLPSPRSTSVAEKAQMKQNMEDLTRQLSNVNFDLLVEGSTEARSDNVANSLLTMVTSGMETDPMSILVVSDQDDYLRSARDMGCFTCRIRQKNAPRGNVTTNFNAEDISEVQDVVDELNGLSFNTAASRS